MGRVSRTVCPVFWVQCRVLARADGLPAAGGTLAWFGGPTGALVGRLCGLRRACAVGVPAVVGATRVPRYAAHRERSSVAGLALAISLALGAFLKPNECVAAELLLSCFSPLALLVFALAFRDHGRPDPVRAFPDLIIAALVVKGAAHRLALPRPSFSVLGAQPCTVRPQNRSRIHVAWQYHRSCSHYRHRYYWVTISTPYSAGDRCSDRRVPGASWWRRVTSIDGSRAVLVVACASSMWLFYSPTAKGYIDQARNSYGVFRVAERPAEDGSRYRELSNSSTSHGKQYLDEHRRNLPVSYYHPTGSNGIALNLRNRPARIAGVGLGTGAVAAYLEPEESLVFYEINPLSEYFARKWFHYLEATKGTVEVRIGDARLLLERERDQEPYDLMFVDAFAGDGIPTHLLTREALAIYSKRLVEDGLLVIHISNRYYDLRSVLSAAARQQGWAARWLSLLADSLRRS